MPDTSDRSSGTTDLRRAASSRRTTAGRASADDGRADHGGQRSRSATCTASGGTNVVTDDRRTAASRWLPARRTGSSTRSSRPPSTTTTDHGLLPDVAGFPEGTTPQILHYERRNLGCGRDDRHRATLPAGRSTLCRRSRWAPPDLRRGGAVPAGRWKRDREHDEGRADGAGEVRAGRGLRARTCFAGGYPKSRVAHLV